MAINSGSVRLFMSSSGLDAYNRSLNGHIKNVRENVEALLSSIHTVAQGNDANFYARVEHAREAINDLRRFFGPAQPVPLLSELTNKIEEFRQNPHSVDLIRYLSEVGPQLMRLAGGAYEQPVVEDQMKSLVNDEQLKSELGELEAKLTELINEKGREISYDLMQEIQRLADLRQSQSRSIFEVILKTDGIYNVLSAAADLLIGAPVCTILKEAAGMALKVKNTALLKAEDKLLAYQDGLSIRMADHLPKLKTRHILSLPSADLREESGS
jgi:hypothetical protein